jgi:hypothetical protein
MFLPRGRLSVKKEAFERLQEIKRQKEVDELVKKHLKA